MKKAEKLEILQKQGKSGPYHLLCITFENGYTCRLFITDEQLYCMTH